MLPPPPPPPLDPTVVTDLMAAIDDVVRGRTAADRASKSLLRRHPDLTNAARREVSTLLFGVACLWPRLDFLLEEARVDVDVPARIAVYRLAVMGLPFSHALDSLPLDDDARARLRSVDVARAEATAATWSAAERIARWHGYPAWLAARLVDERGEVVAEALAAAFNLPGPLTLRANRTRVSREALAARLLDEEGVTVRPHPLAPAGLVVESGRLNVRGARAWREGLFEVQDAGSQLIAEAVGARPGERVLDLCAGAGGKTLALADALGGEGELVASDVDAARLDNLRARARRAGATVSTVLLDADDESLAPVEGDFDRILVDAPCSETGTLRRGPDKKWHLVPTLVVESAALQRRLLERAARRLRPGGTLIYATCSVLTEENEGVWEPFVSAAEGGLVEEPLWEGEASRTTLLPSVQGTDGFFIAKARKAR